MYFSTLVETILLFYLKLYYQIGNKIKYILSIHISINTTWNRFTVPTVNFMFYFREQTINI